MSVTVYTCVIGDYDTITNQPPGEYVSFTFPPQETKPWVNHVPVLRFTNPTRDARMRKILSHQYISSEWSLWIDGCITLMIPPEELVKRYSDNEITMLPSRNYNTLREESEAIIKMKKDGADEIVAQYNRYIKDGYPDLTLSTTGAILRHHTKKVIEFNNYWWSELSVRSHRDQMSVDYAAWKTGVKINYFKDNMYESREFHYGNHNK